MSPRGYARPGSRPSLRGTRGSLWLTIPAGTASGAVRWPGDGQGSVQTSEAASSLFGSTLSRIDRFFVVAAPSTNGQFELRESTGATIRFVFQLLTTANYPLIFALGSGYGVKMPTNGFSVSWTGGGTSPAIHVFYRPLDGLVQT